MKLSKIKPIAFYLPQYHPIAENNQWWGEGFTEWTNVTKAKPLFQGHYQPHLPADLGFYDLRLSETREAQADLAQQYGIYGFCYYHYWFNGKRILERPFNEVLNSGKPSFPFCLCWANENWTRIWYGQDRKILIGQNYSAEDDKEHIRWLAKAFQDERYIRIDGKPLFLVYRASEIPNPVKTTEIWREEAHRLGIGELYLCRVESYPSEQTDPVALGFDAAVEFQPDWAKLNGMSEKKQISKNLGKYYNKIVRKINLNHLSIEFPRIYDYSLLMKQMINQEIPPYKRFPCITPSWDNTARRRKKANILHGSTPSLYNHWLENIVTKVVNNSDQDKFIFINAWNEWAEGNHLEPCQQWGRGYLKATKDALFAKV